VEDETGTDLGNTRVHASGGTERSSYLDLALETGKQYRIFVLSYGQLYDPGAADYHVTVTGRMLDAGLTREDAYPLISGEEKTGDLEDAFSHWYVFRAEAAGACSFSLTDHNLDVPVSLKVYDEQGTELSAAHTETGEDLLCRLHAEIGDVLYVQISRETTSASGAYTLQAATNQQ